MDPPANRRCSRETARAQGVPPWAASVWQSVISLTSTVTSAGNGQTYAMDFVQRCGGGLTRSEAASEAAYLSQVLLRT